MASVSEKCLGEGESRSSKDYAPQASVPNLLHRPDFGTAGRPICLFANLFKLQIPRNQFLYQYTVTISPSKCPVNVNHQVIDTLIKECNRKKDSVFCGTRPAFNGRSNIYSREKLPVGRDWLTINVSLPDEHGGKDRNFKVQIRYAATVDLSELVNFLYHGHLMSANKATSCQQSLDIILRQQPSLCYLSTGHEFFSPPGAHLTPVPIGGGCELWFGFYQNVKTSQWKTLLVNIDVTAKAFYQEQQVLDLLCEVIQKRKDKVASKEFKMDDRMFSTFLDTIKGLKVITTHTGGCKRRYTVTGLDPRSSSALQFTITGESTKTCSETTVMDYFHDRYKIVLKYPHLPCLLVGTNRFMPMELCKLVPCPKNQLSESQRALKQRNLAKPAWEKQENILRLANDYLDKSDYYLKNEFGISMSKTMERVEGRVLDPPTLQFGAGSKQGQLTPYNGQWTMKDKLLYLGVEITTWAVLCYLPQSQCSAATLQHFCQTLMMHSYKIGMPIKNTPCYLDYIKEEQTGRAFHHVQGCYPGLQLILAVIPNVRNKSIYQQVKQVGDVSLGLATQCVQHKKLNSTGLPFFSSIIMKINAKLGGVNHMIQPESQPPIFTEPVIIFGADVTHPASGDTKSPSIAALVGSLDPNASRYCATVRLQNHRVEIIQDLANMVKELLLQFYRKTYLKPTKIIFYRDGVSVGQFMKVISHEVRAVQEACVNLDRGYEPGITYIVVQKRHHVRLFPAERKDVCGATGNIPPGTTVDKGITHPFEFDFYLCSHFGSEGTSRSCHYQVIYDDNGFNADSMQKLTYNLCYTYARCAKSVSMPAPAYYAHLAAFRARYHLADKSGNGSAPVNLQSLASSVKVHHAMESGMYFA